MSYLPHVEACNRFEPERYLPLHIEDRRVGFIRRDAVGALSAFPSVFEAGGDALRFSRALDTAPRRTAALKEVAHDLVRAGAVAGLRGEEFAVTAGWLGPTLFALDRGAVPFFGTRSYGVHLNGYRWDGRTLMMWIGKRSLDKKVAPGKLDNLVAGGIGAGYDAQATLLKEAAEEAGMSAALAGRAHPTGALHYRMDLPGGMRDDVLFTYDLELPADFVPRNTDGEFSDFVLMPFAECLRLVRETDAFKFNVNLVLIDFALRHGFLAPEDPEYLAVLHGLHGGLIREAGAGTDLRG
jgi:8-oxo-dGTP pyrophosphatase MutT (NUDIX family)